jgi:tetratricopeptide (TPR) repeat protein
MCRTVYVGDSGEFSLTLKTLGIAHPPGYPLFTIMGHVFVSLSGFLKPALAANLYGVILAAAGIPALFFLIDGRQRPLIAGVMLLVWAFSPAYWEETNGIEVYALNLALVATLSALALSSYARKWYIIPYLLGLALAHHLSAIAVVPALGYLFLQEKTSNRWKNLPVYAVLFLVGLSIYLYLPARSSVSPLTNWGHPTELKLLFNHITGADYQHAVEFSVSNEGKGLILFLQILLDNWWWIGLGLAVWGAFIGLKTFRRRTTYAFILLGSNLFLSAFYRIEDIDSYYLPGLLAMWLLASQGVMELGRKFPTARYLSFGGTALAVLLLLILNYNKFDQSGNRLAEAYGKLILDTAGEGTIFADEDNSIFASMYMRYAEDYRPQVTVFDPAMRMPTLLVEATKLSGQNVYTFREAIKVFVQEGPGDIYIENPNFAPESTYVESFGVLYSLQPLNRPERPIPDLWPGDPPTNFKARSILVNLEAAKVAMLQKQIPPDSLGVMNHVRRAMALCEHEPRGSMHNQLGLGLQHCGAEEEALSCYLRALDAPRLSAGERKEVHLNLSNLYKDRGQRLAQAEDYVGSVEAFKKALEYNPGDDEVTYNIGLIYVKYLKQMDLGLLYLEEYLQKHPSEQSVAELVTLLRRR